jgi:hypothetical protein
MLFFVGLAGVLLFTRFVTYGKTEERPDTTGNTMQDAQLERALHTVANELDVTLNANFSEADRDRLKKQLETFRIEMARARMNSTSANLSRQMATQPGQVRSAYA